jgi:hypothetical protein
MIFALPGALFAFQKAQQLLPANFLARCFDQEGAAPSRTDQGIDFPQQVLRQQNMGTFRVHMCITSVLKLCALVNTRFRGNRPRSLHNLNFEISALPSLPFLLLCRLILLGRTASAAALETIE